MPTPLKTTPETRALEAALLQTFEGYLERRLPADAYAVHLQVVLGRHGYELAPKRDLAGLR